MIKTLFFLLILFNIGPSGCRCNKSGIPDYECTSDITVPLPEKAVSAFCFKEGSYWIYEREGSLHTDSVWVTSSSTQSYPVDHVEYPDIKEPKCYETRRYFLKSDKAYFFISTDIMFKREHLENTTSYDQELFFLYENPTLGTGNSPQTRAIFGGNRLGENNGFGDTAIVLDSFNHFGTIYSSVFYLKKRLPVATEDYFREAYYAPSYGMIRFMDKDGIWWNVIRCHIVQ